MRHIYLISLINLIFLISPIILIYPIILNNFLYSHPLSLYHFIVAATPRFRSYCGL